jgi:hypothetical protein
LQDLPCYIIIITLYRMTAVSDRSLDGKSRLLGVRNINPGLYQNPSFGLQQHRTTTQTKQRRQQRVEQLAEGKAPASPLSTSPKHGRHYQVSPASTASNRSPIRSPAKVHPLVLE